MKIKTNVLHWQQILVMKNENKKGITICFTCEANVTEVHYDAERIELINEVNDVDIEMKESAISKVVPKETLSPNSSKLMFHVP